MTTYTQKSYKVRTIRITQLDSCGTPVHGSTSTVVSKGLTKVTLTPTYENGTDYMMRNANDEFEVNEQGRPLLRWWDVTIDFVKVDPAVITLTLGWPLVLDDAVTPNITGWRSEEGDTAYWAMEGWQYLANDPTCSTTQPAYGYRLLPYLLNPQLTGDITLENNVTTLSIRAHTHNGSNWGVGPYNVRYNQSAVASPLLTAIQPLQHFHWERVTVAPPTPADGAQALP